MTRHRESISVASLPPKEQAMKNTCVGSGSISALKVRKTHGGGGKILFSFSPTEITDQKQIEFSF